MSERVLCVAAAPPGRYDRRSPGEPTMRQVQVLVRAAHGRTNRQIGLELNVDTETVKTHLQKLAKEWRLRGRTGLVGEGFRRGWLQPISQPCPALSERRAKIMQLVAEGRTYEQVALELMVSAHTVHTHMNRIFKILGVADAAHAVAVWAAAGAFTSAPRREAVTADQAGVLRQIAAGATVFEGARRLGISQALYARRAAELRQLAGVRDDLALVGWAYRSGVLVPVPRPPVQLPGPAVAVLARLSTGMSVKQIAAEMYLSGIAVRGLIENASRALEARALPALVAEAYAAGVLAPRRSR